MRAPSLKTLFREFPRLNMEEAKLIRKLVMLRDDRDALEKLIEQKCSQTHAYARSCYSDPFHSSMWRTTMVLHAIDRILGTCGVEALGPMNDSRVGFAPPFEYCNAGDPYVATLIYNRDQDRLFVGSWGEIVEKHEKEWEES